MQGCRTIETAMLIDLTAESRHEQCQRRRERHENNFQEYVSLTRQAEIHDIANEFSTRVVQPQNK
jgi:hypothetical protein